jgi:hypothetical protein
MAGTTTDGYAFDELTDPIDPVGAVARLASSAQTVLDTVVKGRRQMQTFIWATAGGLSAQTGMVEGDLGYRADVDRYFYYDGSSWLPVAGKMDSFSASGSKSVANATESSMDVSPTVEWSTPGAVVSSSGLVTISGSGAGLWLVSAYIQVQASGASSFVDLWVTKNGTAAGNRVVQDSGSGNATAFAAASRSKLVTVASGDTLRLRARQSTGATATINWEFQGAWIGPGV